MSGRAESAGVGPDGFSFTPDNLKRVEEIVARYPEGRQASAVLAVLDLAQRQHGWLPKAVMDYVADLLRMPRIQVYEVVTFYSMLRAKPMGKHLVHVCTTTPCWLRGSAEVVAACRKSLGIGLGETSADGEFSVVEVECLGACVNAPVMCVGEDYYEDLDGASAEAILEALKRGERPAPGPQIARQTSAPAGGPTTLVEGAGES